MARNTSGADSKPLVANATLRKGLSSELNQRYVLTVLANSTPEQIGELLHKAGYRPTGTKGTPLSHSELTAALRGELAAYFLTSQGLLEFKKILNQLLRVLLAIWLKSSEGRRTIQRMKANVLKEELLQDTDLLASVCQNAVEEHVRRWLQSPLGRETIEQEKRRQVQRQARGVQDTTGASWIERELGVGDTHDQAKHETQAD